MDIFLVSILAFGIVLYVVAAGSQKGGAHKSPKTPLDHGMVRTRLEGIEAQVNIPGGGKTAVMEADKLFDYCLKGKGFEGRTMAERLKKAESVLSDKNGIWRAHKLRNTLAHEVGFEITQGQAEESVAAFKRGFKDLGVL